ncbi:RagB/SusD family nutrient uptake outer membrane protein [Algoriphagus sp. NG3]|uniref:RagB/SusD family nutrient uptake outer membrane protein n=1 Tax=Algoriphagus sp. NG3 TaxID=3097546 RepID=UPI002A803EFB|nr:RagB/SusD family nutrient uptake outer membrane protein [Algoriphagus sp. NG3]WPR77692.1 RagB/SusD family nutrient uptake outer membrane protein [Algoriphagus sp. NG3]
MKNRIILSFILLWGVGCTDYLDPKPNDSMVVPSSVEDIRSLLDNINVFNKQPVLTIHSGDEFFATEAGVASLSDSEMGAYLWLDDTFQGEPSYDWAVPYQQVFYANVALAALDNLGEASPYSESLRGEALFHRAHAYYHLLQQFAPAYRKKGGNEQLPGIVLKDSPDVNEPATRSNLLKCYRQVIEDLNEAVLLLPDYQLPKTRPSKASAFGMLGRVYLQIFEFALAAESAQKALDYYPERQDFNTIDVNSTRPFVQFGEETVFYSEAVTVSYLYSSQVFVDTVLIKEYAEGDLRLPAYYDEADSGMFLHRGRLTGNVLVFGGLSTGEMELIAAEGYARTGEEEKAREFLNQLVRRRIKPENLTEIEATGEALMKTILLERKKELIGRGLRWPDLRRLNQESNYEVTINRIKDGQVITLEPNSSKYVFPIPQEEIVASGIQQNER